jgi:hypothetical protein
MKRAIHPTPKQLQVINRKLAEAKFTRLLKAIIEMRSLSRDQRARMILDLKKKLKL